MNHRLSTVVTKSILAYTLLLGIQTPLYAHGIVSKEIEPGKIRFSYDDDSPMPYGYISIFDQEGKEIATGQTDAEGLFDYSKHENAATISASDTHGHHQSHIIGTETHTPGHAHGHSHDHHSSDSTTIIAVAVALMTIAAVFYFGTRKKDGSST